MRAAIAIFALVVASLALPASADAASRSTARVTSDVPLRAGPGLRYRVIDILPDGSRVRLERCTSESNWCLVLLEGEPAGWARGSALLGAGAKLEVTPHKFLGFDPLDPLPGRGFSVEY